MSTRLFAVFSNPGDCEEALLEARDRGLIEDEGLLKIVDKPNAADALPFLDTDVFVDGLVGFFAGGLAGVLVASALGFFSDVWSYPNEALLLVGSLGGAVFGGLIGLLSGTQHENYERDSFMEYYRPGDKVMFVSAPNENIAQRLLDIFYDHHARKVQLA